MKDLDSCWLDRIGEFGWLALTVTVLQAPWITLQKTEITKMSSCFVQDFSFNEAVGCIRSKCPEWPVKGKQLHLLCLMFVLQELWIHLNECTISVWGKLTLLPVSPSNFDSVLPSYKLSTTIPSFTESPQSGLKQKKKNNPKQTLSIHIQSGTGW